jgi:hypothetical protein
MRIEVHHDDDEGDHQQGHDARDDLQHAARCVDDVGAALLRGPVIGGASCATFVPEPAMLPAVPALSHVPTH